MRYKEIAFSSNCITEGRDANLYHGTDLVSAIQIIRDNEMRGTTEKLYLPRAVSTTRDPKFAFEVGEWFDRQYPVIFVLNQTRLSQRYVIEPHSDKNQSGVSWGGYYNRGVEAEERIIGNIYPLEPYIISINTNPQFIELAKKDINFWIENEIFSTAPEAQMALLSFKNHPKFNAIRLSL